MATRLEAALERVDEQITREAGPPGAPFTEEFLGEIRQTDMMSVVGEYVTKPFGRGRMVNCPFHDDKNPSMQVHDDHAHCFGCHWHGDQIKFVMEIERVNFRQAVARIAAIAGLPLTSADPGERDELQRRQRERRELCEWYERERLDAAVRIPALFQKAESLLPKLPKHIALQLDMAIGRLFYNRIGFLLEGDDGEYPTMAKAEENLRFEISAAEFVIDLSEETNGQHPLLQPPKYPLRVYPERRARLRMLIERAPRLKEILETAYDLSEDEPQAAT